MTASPDRQPMPTYAVMDPAVLAFVIIPLLLVALLLWGVSTASRRLAEPDATRRRALAVTLAAAAAWMTATWAPFVWLPAVMVLTALAGHLIVFRAIGR